MFRTGVVVVGNEFLDRKKHVPLFMSYMGNNQSVMIKAPRRFGKTSLVKHVLEGNNNYSSIIVDLKRSVSLELLTHEIIDKAYALAGIDGFIAKVVKKGGSALLEVFNRLKSIKIDAIGEITLNQINEQKDTIELFLHALDVVEQIGAKKKINIKLVLDEFQDILSLSDKTILDKMRSVAQHQKSVTYVFLGSIESIMTKIFEEKKSPFFHFAQIMPLPPLDTEEIKEYAFEKFAALGIKDTAKIGVLIDVLGGHPDYTMQALQQLYYGVLSETITVVNDSEVSQILYNVQSSNEPYIAELIARARQKKHHMEVLYFMANGEDLPFDSATCYYIRTSLEDMGLIKKVGIGEYEIVDVLLKAMLQAGKEGSIANFANS